MNDRDDIFSVDQFFHQGAMVLPIEISVRRSLTTKVHFLILFVPQVLPLCQNHCTQIGYSFGYSSTPTPPEVPSSAKGFRPRRHSEKDEDISGPALDDPLASTRLFPEQLPTPTTPGVIIPPAASSYQVKPTQREYQAQFRYQ